MAKTTGNIAKDKVIGAGINYPVTFADNSNNQLLELSSGSDVINQAIFLIIDTRKGSRYNNNNFGCDVKNLVFEPNDNILKDLLYISVYSALQEWEKRISIQSITFATHSTDPNINENQINIVVNYMILATHTEGTFVYPYVNAAEPTSDLFKGPKSFNLTSFNKKG